MSKSGSILMSAEVPPQTPLCLEDAIRSVTIFVDRYSNDRLHSAIGYVVQKTNLKGWKKRYVYRRTQWIALFTTDLSLSVTQMIELYGARWKIESGFKEIKRDIGAGNSQTRNAQAVMNHLNFCMMAVTVT